MQTGCSDIEMNNLNETAMLKKRSVAESWQGINIMQALQLL